MVVTSIRAEHQILAAGNAVARETHLLLSSLSPFWEEWAQDNRSQESLWKQELGLLHWEQMLVDRLQSLDHRSWVPQYDQFYTLPKLIQSDTMHCKWSKHSDLIYSLAEKHFLLQGQNPTVSAGLCMKLVTPKAYASQISHVLSPAFNWLGLPVPDGHVQVWLSAAPWIQWLKQSSIHPNGKGWGRAAGG